MIMTLMSAILLSAKFVFAGLVSQDDGLAGEALGRVQVGEKASLETTGFKILERNETLQIIQFRDDAQLTISKAKFASIEQADAFCTQRKLRLHKNAIEFALLIATSGAANLDDELKSAISFEISTQGGIWAWQGPDDKLIAMLNGKGGATELVDVSKLREAARNQGLALATFAPAICIDEQ